MLSSIPLRISYRSGHDDVLEDFYRPCLEQASTYRRAVGYFTSAGLAHAAKGIASLVTRGGRMQLVASPQLLDEDIDALSRAAVNPEKVLEQIAARSLQDVTDLLSQERLNALAWLSASGALEVKLAIRLNAQGNPTRGIYHEKIGVFSDECGNHVAFAGSSNETEGGLVENFESIKVFWSWDDAHERVKEEIENFDALWGNRTHGLRVLEFSETSRELLRRYQQSAYPIVDLPSVETSVVPPVLISPMIPDWCRLRGYQEEAIQKWINAKGCGILAMATGTGKTLTALNLAMRVYAKHQPVLLLIVCPFVNLAEQWVRELTNFGIPSVRCYHSSDRWKEEASNTVQRLQLKIETIAGLVVTNRTFLSAAFQETLRPTAFHHLLIADEVHHLGATAAAKSLPDGIKMRLGLSATPTRYKDEDGTRQLFGFFGGVVFEFGIKEALKTISDSEPTKTILCPYEYYPILVSLDDDEADKYIAFSERLARCWGNDGDGEPSDAAKFILIARARLVAGARQKLPALDAVLCQLGEPPQKAIFYCGDGTTDDPITEQEIRQIDAVSNLVGINHELRISTFTCRESANEREGILRRLADGSLHGVVAIRCLDEGIDMPDMRMAFLLASSTNPRQSVQRRGRLLRNAPGKDRAVIYDFIVQPPDFGGDASAYNLERSLFSRELSRIKEFCETAENGPTAFNSLLHLRQRYQLVAL